MRPKLWLYIITVLILLWALSLLTAKFIQDGVVDFSDKIAVIPIEGMLTIEGNGGASSTELMSYITAAGKDESVKGVIFEINSPGGTVVASSEIAHAIKNLKKPKIALIREVGASGAYWAASAADKIVADPMSVTGSIGVIGSYLEFSELMKNYGVGYEELTAGKYKDAGDPFKKLSIEERELIQKQLNTIHDYFISEVSTNRGLPKQTIKELAEGQVFLGVDAQKLGLIDYLGGKDLAVNLTKQMANITTAKLVVYKKERNFLQQLLEEASANAFYSMGKGIGYELTKTEKAKGLELTV